MIVLAKVSRKYLYTFWMGILTIGLCTALFGIQKNSNDDYAHARRQTELQGIAFCHALADSNQAVLDLLSILTLPSPIRDDMTASQKETLQIANRRKLAYQQISHTLFGPPQCPDEYKATSHQKELLPLAEGEPS